MIHFGYWYVRLRLCGKREIACRVTDSETQTDPDSNDDKVQLFNIFMIGLVWNLPYWCTILSVKLSYRYLGAW